MVLIWPQEHSSLAYQICLIKSAVHFLTMRSLLAGFLSYGFLEVEYFWRSGHCCDIKEQKRWWESWVWKPKVCW